MTRPRSHRRWARAAVLPALVLVGVPVGYALVQGIGSSFGFGSPAGSSGIGLDAYRRVIGAPDFARSLAFSLWVAGASSVLAVGGGALVTWIWISRPGRVRTVDLWLILVSLSVPHVAWAVALLAALSQSGWAARLAASIGLIDRPDQFPVLVQDQAGVGIIAHIVTKELAFVVLVTVPLANRRAVGAVRAAATLGASATQQFRMVFLPAVAPALVPAFAVIFAFGLGGYEPQSILGVQNPRTLSVIALDRFRDPDLARRADAFAISTVLGVLSLGAALMLWLTARRWVRPHLRELAR